MPDGRRRYHIVNSAPAPPREPTRIRSVIKAVRILDVLATRDPPRTAKEIAGALGYPVATTHHLLDTLVGEGLVLKSARRLYHLGPRIGVLADAYHRDNEPPEHLLAPLRRLAEETGETTYLSRREDDDAVISASREGSHAVRVSSLHRGYRGCPHARAAGKAILAFGPADAVDRLLGRGPLERLTARTITAPDALRAELAAIRERGYALDAEEFTEGVSCVAAPVLEHGVAIATYTVAAPSDRFEVRREELVRAVQEAAREGRGA